MTAIIADLQVSSNSLQYVRVPVAADNASDPTGNPVAMAFPAPAGEPVTFYTGNWESLGGLYYARCLVGPSGTVTLPVGFYDVYVKITSNPEVPVLFAGLLEVT